jgi:hypothetical protein
LERKLVQLVRHHLRDYDSLALHALGLSRVPLLVGIGDELPNVGFLQSVEYVPKVFVIWLPALGQFVREEAHESLVSLDLRPEVFDAQFVVAWHVNFPNGINFHKFFFI